MAAQIYHAVTAFDGIPNLPWSGTFDGSPNLPWSSHLGAVHHGAGCLETTMEHDNLEQTAMEQDALRSPWSRPPWSWLIRLKRIYNF
jgi:hypothetical protein